MKTQMMHLRFEQLEAREVLSNSVLGIASYYNAFIFGDMHSQYSDTEGRIAVGGDACFDGYSVGARLSSSGAGDSLVVGGHLYYTNGQVANGNVVYGSWANTSSFGIPNGSVRQGYSVDFSSAWDEATSTSASMASQSANGTVTNNYGSLTLTGSSSGTNVFYVTAEQLANANGITINVPEGSTVIINVSGTDVSIRYMGITVNGTSASNVIWNMYEATSLTMDGIGMQGSILAPYANVTFNNGQMNGTLVARSFCGNGQLNWVPNETCTYSTLSGSVYSDDGQPLEGVTIVLNGRDTKGNTVYRTTQTDRNGYYTFEDIAPGDYSVTVCLPSNGYTRATSTAGNLGGNACDDTITNIGVGSCVVGRGYQFTLYCG